MNHAEWHLLWLARIHGHIWENRCLSNVKVQLGGELATKQYVSLHMGEDAAKQEKPTLNTVCSRVNMHPYTSNTLLPTSSGMIRTSAASANWLNVDAWTHMFVCMCACVCACMWVCVYIWVCVGVRSCEWVCVCERMPLMSYWSLYCNKCAVK